MCFSLALLLNFFLQRFEIVEKQINFLGRCLEVYDCFPFLQHYLAKHAEKKHKCPKCGKRFGDHSTCEQHTLSCRRLFYCSCGCYYTTLLALKNHIVRKGPEHKIIGEKDSETDVLKPVVERYENNFTFMLYVFYSFLYPLFYTLSIQYFLSFYNASKIITKAPKRPSQQTIGPSFSISRYARSPPSKNVGFIAQMKAL